eukprot:1006150-Alexandrium_andersonii.AAC.1
MPDSALARCRVHLRPAGWAVAGCPCRALRGAGCLPRSLSVESPRRSIRCLARLGRRWGGVLATPSSRRKRRRAR